MIKSELITQISKKYTANSSIDVEFCVNHLLEHIIDKLSHDIRIEVRGFGSFCLHHKTLRHARNPKTGMKVVVTPSCKLYFRPGQELRQRINNLNNQGKK